MDESSPEVGNHDGLSENEADSSLDVSQAGPRYAVARVLDVYYSVSTIDKDCNVKSQETFGEKEASRQITLIAFENDFGIKQIVDN